MYDWTDDNYHVNKLMSALQDMEEISGPDSLAEYVAVLEVISVEINKRLEVAKARIANGEK
jgi:hypothetical protein